MLWEYMITYKHMGCPESEKSRGGDTPCPWGQNESKIARPGLLGLRCCPKSKKRVPRPIPKCWTNPKCWPCVRKEFQIWIECDKATSYLHDTTWDGETQDQRSGSSFLICRYMPLYAAVQPSRDGAQLGPIFTFSTISSAFIRDAMVF